jgi:hypothetical protein
MAATDHTRLRTARPSADSKSTDISRNLPPGMEVPPGAGPACDAETTNEALHGSTDAQSIDGAASASSEPAQGVPADAPLVRAHIRSRVGNVCDYLELGSSLATVASRTASASIYSDDQLLADNLADLADLLEEQVAHLRRTAGIVCVPSAARPSPPTSPSKSSKRCLSERQGQQSLLKALLESPRQELRG